MNIMFLFTPKSEIVYEDINSTMRQVSERMDFNRVSAIPLINSEGHYVGTLTEGDLFRMLKDTPGLKFEDTSKIMIDEIPRKIEHKPVNINTDINSIIELARTQNFVPVTDDDGIFIGIIKRGDIIDYCYKNMCEKK